MGPGDNKSWLVKVMAGRRVGEKRWPKPMTNQFTDSRVRHQASLIS